jgi:hypothetical protein
MVGVIVGYDGEVGEQMAQEMIGRLSQIFPGVQFAIIPHANSITFEFNELANANGQRPGPKRDPDPRRAV